MECFEQSSMSKMKFTIAWLRHTIRIRKNNPSNYSSDYSRGELRGYEESLKKIININSGNFDD